MFDIILYHLVIFSHLITNKFIFLLFISESLSTLTKLSSDFFFVFMYNLSIFVWLLLRCMYFGMFTRIFRCLSRKNFPHFFFSFPFVFYFCCMDLIKSLFHFFFRRYSISWFFFLVFFDSISDVDCEYMHLSVVYWRMCFFLEHEE